MTGGGTGGGTGAAEAHAMDLSPAPGPASLRVRLLRQGRTEARLQLRNGEQLLLSLLIPAAVLVIGRFAAAGLIGVDELTGSVLALALWSSGFTATAIATGFERRYGVLERLAATPLQRSGLILGKAIGVILVTTVQLVVLGALAVALGWRPVAAAGGATVLAVVLTSLAAMTAFVAGALLMAGRLRAEVTLALANVVHLALAAGGGVVVPADRFPAPVATVVGLLPTGALGAAWRGFSTGAAVTWWPVAVAVVWAVGLAALASKGFRWLS